MTTKELDELELWVKNSHQSVVKTDTVLALIAAARERDALLKAATTFVAARTAQAVTLAATTDEMLDLSDAESEAAEGLIRTSQALTQHRGEADRGRGG